MVLGDRLKHLRNAKNLTQTQLSKELNISRGTYAHYEINKREPDFDTLQKLADFYNVSTDYLLGRSNEMMSVSYLKSDITTFVNSIDEALHHYLTTISKAIVTSSGKAMLKESEIEEKLFNCIIKNLEKQNINFDDVMEEVVNADIKKRYEILVPTLLKINNYDFKIELIKDLQLIAHKYQLIFDETINQLEKDLDFILNDLDITHKGITLTKQNKRLLRLFLDALIQNDKEE